jgi:hypothetical protein
MLPGRTARDHQQRRASSNQDNHQPWQPPGPIMVARYHGVMAMTYRPGPDLEEKLKFYRLFLGKSANVLINDLLREFFECQGDTEIAKAMTEQAKKTYGKALAELREQ